VRVYLWAACVVKLLLDSVQRVGVVLFQISPCCMQLLKMRQLQDERLMQFNTIDCGACEAVWQP
jgi:hypothetical protein